MRRNVSLEEISDGRLYTANDMVRADCGGCTGCSSCCRGMGSSIVLDPLDADRLSKGTGKSMERMLAEGYVELNVADGIILPNLAMDAQTDACRFLDANGRCSVHPYRTGICRLFPLGRFYHGTDASGREIKTEGFRYFLQKGECPKAGKTKVRVSKWLDTHHLKEYEAFVLAWHTLLEEAVQKQETMNDEERQNCALLLLRLFYLRPYQEEFYREIKERIRFFRDALEN